MCIGNRFLWIYKKDHRSPSLGSVPEEILNLFSCCGWEIVPRRVWSWAEWFMMKFCAQPVAHHIHFGHLLWHGFDSWAESVSGVFFPVATLFKSLWVNTYLSWWNRSLQKLRTGNALFCRLLWQSIPSFFPCRNLFLFIWTDKKTLRDTVLSKTCIAFYGVIFCFH